MLLLYSVQAIIIAFLDEYVKRNNDGDALELWETAKRLNESVGVYSR